jgi:hypothetical protein
LGVWSGEIADEDIYFKIKYERITGSDVDYNQVKKLKKILEYCKEKNIVVYGFFPPFAPSVLKKMKSENYDFSFIKKSLKEINKLFKENNYEFKDFTNYILFDDSFYLDGSHANRNIYFQILKDLKIQTNSYFDNDFQIKREELESLKSFFK